MSDCPTQCPDFKKYIESLRTIACPKALSYIDELAKSPAFAEGVRLYTKGHEVYKDVKGSAYSLLKKVMDKKTEDGDRPKLVLGYTLRRIAETGECDLSDSILNAARESGILKEEEIGVELLRKIRNHASEISSWLNKESNI